MEKEKTAKVESVESWIEALSDEEIIELARSADEDWWEVTGKWYFFRDKKAQRWLRNFAEDLRWR